MPIRARYIQYIQLVDSYIYHEDAGICICTIICMVHSYVNSAITMFTLVTVDVNLCHACKKSINNTQNEVERHSGPDIHSRLASRGP